MLKYMRPPLLIRIWDNRLKWNPFLAIIDLMFDYLLLEVDRLWDVVPPLSLEKSLVIVGFWKPVNAHIRKFLVDLFPFRPFHSFLVSSPLFFLLYLILNKRVVLLQILVVQFHHESDVVERYYVLLVVLAALKELVVGQMGGPCRIYEPYLSV